ncbi:MAG: hypothetical protein ACYSUN_16010 [Planctomycetota bacterium]|jgi:hypothetical protein
MPDFQAFADLVEVSSLRMAELGDHPVDAVRHVSADMGLPRGHWLIRHVLAEGYQMFELDQGRFFAETPQAFLGQASAEDLQRHGPETTAWARKLAGMETDH